MMGRHIRTAKYEKAIVKSECRKWEKVTGKEKATVSNRLSGLFFTGFCFCADRVIAEIFGQEYRPDLLMKIERFKSKFTKVQYSEKLRKLNNKIWNKKISLVIL